MNVLPVSALIGAAVALGAYLGWQYLRAVPRKPLLIGIHLILGLAGMKWLILLLLWRTPDGSVTHTLGSVTALLLAASMLSGLLTPLLTRERPRAVGNVAQVIHSGFGAAGFLVFLVWIWQL